jgi:Ca2+/Na+ antiporter
MKRLAYRFCAFLATVVAVWVLYRYGMSPATLLLALLLLSCPVIVIWLSLRQARQTKRDIETAVRMGRATRSRPERDK